MRCCCCGCCCSCLVVFFRDAFVLNAFCCWLFDTLLLHKLASYLGVFFFFLDFEHHTHNLRPHFRCFLTLPLFATISTTKISKNVFNINSWVNYKRRICACADRFTRKKNSIDGWMERSLSIFIDILFRSSRRPYDTFHFHAVWPFFGAHFFFHFISTHHIKCSEDFSAT